MEAVGSYDTLKLATRLHSVISKQTFWLRNACFTLVYQSENTETGDKPPHANL